MKWKGVDPHGALFSECSSWRYLLWRELSGGLFETVPTSCLFIMLNPSTADASKDDPTVRRCVDYATRWGFGQLMVCNLFGYRSTDPQALHGVTDPIGPENDATILMAARTADMIVCGWGEHGTLNGRSNHVMQMLADKDVRLHCLDQNLSGQPVHPLYQRKDLRPQLIQVHSEH